MSALINLEQRGKFPLGFLPLGSFLSCNWCFIRVFKRVAAVLPACFECYFDLFSGFLSCPIYFWFFPFHLLPTFPIHNLHIFFLTCQYPFSFWCFWFSVWDLYYLSTSPPSPFFLCCRPVGFWSTFSQCHEDWLGSDWRYWTSTYFTSPEDFTLRSFVFFRSNIYNLNIVTVCFVRDKV